jgi:general stress protein YciG
MQERGSRGGQKTVATLGVDHMRAIGGKGGSKSLGTKRPRTARG